MPNNIEARRIRTDLDTQSRITLNEDIVREYAEAMEAGTEFPAILVFYDETNDLYILVDGFHRYAAHMRVRPNDWILAEMRLGTVEDAKWESIAANKSHGLRRTNEDKRNATKQALLHPKGVDLSNVKIAEHVGVNDKTVAAVRRDLEMTSEIPKSNIRVGQDGRTIDTSRIGKLKSATPPHGSTCAICYYFDKDTCKRDDSQPLPWTSACEHFETKEIDIKTSRQKEPSDKPRIERGRNPNQNRRYRIRCR